MTISNHCAVFTKPSSYLLLISMPESTRLGPTRRSKSAHYAILHQYPFFLLAIRQAFVTDVLIGPQCCFRPDVGRRGLIAKPPRWCGPIFNMCNIGQSRRPIGRGGRTCAMQKGNETNRTLPLDKCGSRYDVRQVSHSFVPIS